MLSLIKPRFEQAYIGWDIVNDQYACSHWHGPGIYRQPRASSSGVSPNRETTTRRPAGSARAASSREMLMVVQRRASTLSMRSNIQGPAQVHQKMVNQDQARGQLAGLQRRGHEGHRHLWQALGSGALRDTEVRARADRLIEAIPAHRPWPLQRTHHTIVLKHDVRTRIAIEPPSVCFTASSRRPPSIRPNLASVDSRWCACVARSHADVRLLIAASAPACDYAIRAHRFRRACASEPVKNS